VPSGGRRGIEVEGIDMRRIAALSAQLVVTATLGLTGCCYYELRDSIDECCCDIRAEHAARRAWCHCEDAYDEHPYKCQFGRGFKDGYASVACGGDGCCPTIPPRSCWGWCYDGCEGQQRINAWFDGWARGAVAAEADGLSGFGRIVVRRPSCPTGCNVGRPLLPPGATMLPGPAPTYIEGPVTPPPPAPPSVAPGAPAAEAYESYDEGGLYYE
jgi:hypothetical protein